MSDCEIASFSKIAIPLVRKVYLPLIAQKLVSVQPLSGPSSLVHYLRWKYSTNSKTPPMPEPEEWTIKPKKKKIWRDINDPWEITIDS